MRGFGQDGLRATSSLSPRDDHGHGTEVASIVAGNAGISVQARGQRAARYSGLAPQARLAVYKACWTAPDPVDDGCATADLVTAIDRATRDRVDVLNLSVAGPPGFDTVERALLGAAEGDVVVVGAAGNRGQHAYAAHPSPWVLSVGATTGARRRGEVVLGGGATVVGAMAVRTPGRAGPAGPRRRGRSSWGHPGGGPAVHAGEPGRVPDDRRRRAVSTRRDRAGREVGGGPPGRRSRDGARQHPPRHGRVRPPLRADGPRPPLRGRPRSLIHAARPHARVSLRPLPTERTPAGVARWSATGDPTATLVKPDLVAPGAGVLGAVPPSVSPSRWDFASGTSAATAWTSGLAARLLARTHWSADRIRSALVTSAGAVPGSSTVLRSGAGRPRPDRAERPGLAYLVRPGDYRAWLDGDLERDLNTPSILLSEHGDTVHRTVTNVSRRASYFSVRVSGFETHDVRVTPVALRIRPGDSARFTVEVTGPEHAHPVDDGWITWLGADGTRTRIPVVLTR